MTDDTMLEHDQTPRRSRIHAGAALDAEQVAIAPATIVIDDDRIVDIGPPDAVPPTPDLPTIDRTAHLIVPGFVNVHAHLDLTHLGPRPFTGDFASWARMIRTHRTETPADLLASVDRGIALARAGGTVAIGDIAGTARLEPAQALTASPLAGVSFLEVFGIGRGADQAPDTIRRLLRDAPLPTARHRIGVQPHAPYSCSLETYTACIATGRPLSTHLAETRDEDRFVRDADGPLAEMLRDIGVWSDGIRAAGVSPVQHLADHLRETAMVAVHANDIDDRDLAILVGTSTTIAYCPRASAYFGHPHPGERPHRYREMIDVGINVALGTDSIVCLDTPDRISVFDEMRALRARDGVDTRVLLRLGTINGARALGIDPSACTLSPGVCLGLVALETGPGDATSRWRHALSPSGNVTPELLWTCDTVPWMDDAR